MMEIERVIFDSNDDEKGVIVRTYITNKDKWKDTRASVTVILKLVSVGNLVDEC